MNDVLKVGIMWTLVSIPLMYFINAELWRNLIVATIGIVLTIIGFIYQIYLEWKFETRVRYKLTNQGLVKMK